MKPKLNNDDEVVVHFETPTTRRAREKKQQKERRAFSRVPLFFQKTFQTKRAATWKVVLAILFKDFLNNHRPFALSNVLMAEWGVDGQAKRRALKELESGGWISVTQKGKAAPRITVLPRMWG